jgi:uncharacterized protein YyaL (SSP411 family)
MVAGTRQIVVVGEAADDATQALLGAVHARFLPHSAILLVDSPESRAFFATGAPSIGEMQAVEGRASVYVCRDFTCQLPVSTAAELEKLL